MIESRGRNQRGLKIFHYFCGVEFELWPGTCFLDSALIFCYFNSGNSIHLLNWWFGDVWTLGEQGEEFF